MLLPGMQPASLFLFSNVKLQMLFVFNGFTERSLLPLLCCSLVTAAGHGRAPVPRSKNITHVGATRVTATCASCLQGATLKGAAAAAVVVVVVVVASVYGDER